MKCKRCSGETCRIIYMGLPGRMCVNDECASVWGMASWAMSIWFNGYVAIYEGAFLPNWWHWMFGARE